MRFRSEELQRREEDRADLVGVICSATCAVHCLATPLVIAFLPALSIAGYPIGVALESPWIHQAVATVGVSLACISILPFALRRRYWGRLACMLTAVSLLLLSAVATPSDCCGLLFLLSQERTLDLGIGPSNLQTAFSLFPLMGGCLLAFVHGLNIASRRKEAAMEGSAEVCCLELVCPLNDFDSADYAAGRTTEPLAQAG